MVLPAGRNPPAVGALAKDAAGAAETAETAGARRGAGQAPGRTRAGERSPTHRTAEAKAAGNLSRRAGERSPTHRTAEAKAAGNLSRRAGERGPTHRTGIGYLVRPYSTASDRASQLASMMLVPAPTVVQRSPAATKSTSTRVIAAVPWALSRMRTL